MEPLPLACPYCRAKAPGPGESFHGPFATQDVQWRVYCYGCGASGPPADDRESALALWDRVARLAEAR
jgi:hypothetical protein